MMILMMMRTERGQVFSTKDGVLKQNLASKQTTNTSKKCQRLIVVLRFRTRNRRRWKGKDELKSE